MKLQLNKIRSFYKKIWFTVTYVVVVSGLSTSLYMGWLISDEILSYKIYPKNRPALDMDILNSIVVLAPDEDLKRNDIVEILNEISEYSPKAVFLDFFFTYEEDGDSALIAAIKRVPNLIMCVAIDNSKDAIDRMPNNVNTYFLDSLNSCKNIYWGNSLFKSYYNIENKVIPYTMWKGEKIKPAGIVAAEMFTGKRCNWVTPQFIDFNSLDSIGYCMVDHISSDTDIDNKIVLVTDKTKTDLHETSVGLIYGCFTHFAVCYQTIKALNNNEVGLSLLQTFGISILITIFFIGMLLFIFIALSKVLSCSFGGIIKQIIILIFTITLNAIIVINLPLDPKWIYLFFTIFAINIILFPIFDSYKYGTELYTRNK